MPDIGVITEQGFPAGEFGYTKLNEEDQEKLKKSKDKPNK
jgi:hypothetical protein